VLAALYHIRWADGDRHALRHWKRISVFLQEMEEPVVGSEQVKNLVRFNGIAEGTVKVLMEVWRTGYCERIDNLFEEIKWTRRHDADRLQRLEGIEKAVKGEGPYTVIDDLRKQHLERATVVRFEPNREAARRRREESDLKKAEEAIAKKVCIDKIGTLLTGQQRLDFIAERSKSSNNKRGKKRPAPVKEENDTTSGIIPRTTRSQHKRLHVERLQGALKEEDRCAICLQEYEPKEELIGLFCCHVFHKQCMHNWVKTHMTNPEAQGPPKCPYCKQRVTDI